VYSITIHSLVMTDKDLIEALGGIRPCARALGHRWPSLVQYWWEKGRITKPEQRDLMVELVKARARCTGKSVAAHAKTEKMVNEAGS